MAKYEYKCCECGSKNIQMLMWVNPNTNEICGDNEEKECWCEDCEDHTPFECITINE